MKTSKKIIAIVAGVLAVIVTFGVGFWVSRATLDKDLNEINYILTMYRQYYYDEQEDVIHPFADSLLDQYSDYYTADEYNTVQQQDGGRREGIGITVSNLNIVTVSGNSPAQNAGILEGDIIKAIKKDGETDFTYINTQQEFFDLYDTIADNVDFTIMVNRNGEDISCTMSRRAYIQTFVRFKDKTGVYGFSNASGKMEMVRLTDSDITEDGVGYIDLDWFIGTDSGLNGVMGQFKSAMDKFKANGLKNLILDLRGNGGGFMHILQDISSYLIDVKDGSRECVSIARDKYGKEEIFNSEPVKYHEYGIEKIAVLANSGTASASEVLLGALLDYNSNLGIFVEPTNTASGKVYRTYGKGIMQTTFERVGGGAIKLTTAKIFFPKSDVSIHGVGVTTALNEKYPNKIFESDNSYQDALSFCKNMAN